MESLPDAIFQHILSYINDAKDVAVCNCVSKQWKESMPYITSLYFPHDSFDNCWALDSPDKVVWKMISSIQRLEELVVYSPFTSVGLALWLSVTDQSLKILELLMDNLEYYQSSTERPSKLDCIGAARNLETLKLWSLLMTKSPKWDSFEKLLNLEIVGAEVEDHALSVALQACPNLTNLILLHCKGARSVSIDLLNLEHCTLDFYASGNCWLTLSSPKIQSLDVRGCSWIKALQTKRLRKLSIANDAVYMADFGQLPALEFLSIKGVQWRWDVLSKLLQLGSEVKHLYMKVEFTGDTEILRPIPEIDFVDFFNSHPKLQKFDIHGTIFEALSQKNSLKNVESGFVIPCLEEVVITVRSSRNAWQQLETLESLLKYGKNMKSMVIRIIFQMSFRHYGAEALYDQIRMFKWKNEKIVRIE